MCEGCLGRGLTRRSFLVISAIGVSAGVVGVAPAAASLPATSGAVDIGGGHQIRPRDVWGADLPPTGPLSVEAPGDVRFLLVHHSASPNGYSAEQSIGLLRRFYQFHTSQEKGWSDIAYNFLVDEHGQIFEGRAGSLMSPVRGDATGGSQGFALLCCFIGDHSEVAPTDAAQSAMVALLAWLAESYGIDTTPGATAEFVSRGSNRHATGVSVATPTIAGHRNMSLTICPGDEAFALVEQVFPEWVSSGTRPAVIEPAEAASSSVAPPTAAPTTAMMTSVPPSTVPRTTVTVAPPSPSDVTQTSRVAGAPSTSVPTAVAAAVGESSGSGGAGSGGGFLGLAGAVGVAFVGMAWWRWRRSVAVDDGAADRSPIGS